MSGGIRLPSLKVGLLKPRFVGGAGGRRRSLQRKLGMLTIFLVVVPMLVYAFWNHRIAGDAMQKLHWRNVSVLGQTLGASLASRLSENNLRADEVLNALEMDPRLAFVIVEDPHNRTLYRKTMDEQALMVFEQWRWAPGRFGAMEIDRPVVMGEAQDLIVRKVPIWNPPLRIGVPLASDADVERALEGFVIVALREAEVELTLARMQANQIAAAALICLVTVPVVMWSVRRWMTPLRALLAAIGQLGQGQAPAPVEVTARDELGLLAEAFNDVASNLVAARQALQASNEDLERKVQTRTAELEQLNRRLETEINDRNEFLRAVTHDLSAPLRNINGMTTLLLMKNRAELSDDAQQKLERINANVKMQTDLIGDLLELSRLRTRPLKNERVDLQELVEGLRETLAYDLERANITLRIADRLPIIRAERTRMRQLFQNLLDNAVKYMLDAPRRQITVSWDALPDQLRFTVADTGSGICAEELPRIFDVFHRSTTRHSAQVQGRGVGLASVKAIVELYGGQVAVESTPGVGSMFHLTLDRRIVQPEAMGEPRACPASVG